jgi:hypothetical protein
VPRALHRFGRRRSLTSVVGLVQGRSGEPFLLKETRDETKTAGYMKKIDTIKLDGGAYIKQFPRFLTYHTGKAVKTYQVGYTIGEDEYILDGIATEVGATVKKPKTLEEQESAQIVLKLRDALKENGIAVTANVAE